MEIWGWDGDKKPAAKPKLGKIAPARAKSRRSLNHKRNGGKSHNRSRSR